MSRKRSDNIKTITLPQMEEAIKRSGYLIEQRVEHVLTSAHYLVETNPVFPDHETGKSREFDIRAISAVQIYKEGANFIFPVLICECKNNVQPIVFFIKESPDTFLYQYDIKISGIPIKFWDNDEY